ncbi:hypothetical protein HBO37_19165 [Pseudomonas proteolytica]|uniref:hypothetical protein n=1 Tax=Pseudomonas proteolytica TaxID=219574 RepID=UPI001475E449|nr:hypothetical protein [Pseudomonas proteolytica]NMZ07471.1 hypothetical protein [Pseudomonas proteolytica]
MKSRTVELARALGDVTTVIEVEKYMSSAADLARLRADMGDDAFTSTNHLPPAAAPRV